MLALPYDRDDPAVLLNRAWACYAAGQQTMKQPTRAREWLQESLDHFRLLGTREEQRRR